MKIKTYSVISLSLLTYFVASLFISAENLPDYTSYKDIYAMNAGNFEMSGHDLVFVYIVQFLNYLGLSYEEFRIAVSAFAIGLVITSMSLLKGYSGWVAFKKRVTIFDLFLAVVLFCAVLVFALEFFSVRIRGGLSIGFFMMAFALWVTQKDGLTRLPMAALFFILSLGTHFFTAVTLFSFLLLPTLFFGMAKFFKKVLGKHYLFPKLVFVTTLIGLVFLFGVVMMAASRGANLDSPLNFVRYLSLAAIPLVIVGLGYAGNTRAILAGLEIRQQLQGAGHYPRARKKKFWLKESWVSFISVLYAGFAVALTLLDFSGFISTAGEAMVRIFTLSSVVSILVLSVLVNKLNYLWVFLIVSNSLFFLNTVFF